MALVCLAIHMPGSELITTPPKDWSKGKSQMFQLQCCVADMANKKESGTPEKSSNINVIRDRQPADPFEGSANFNPVPSQSLTDSHNAKTTDSLDDVFELRC